MADKLRAGWVHGEVKDADAKTHPCIVPFDQLPRVQQAKDKLFRAVVAALRP
ncbi:RyR domain-containing protein [Bradyrhizobium oligotrophicum S58]